MVIFYRATLQRAVKYPSVSVGYMPCGSLGPITTDKYTSADYN